MSESNQLATRPTASSQLADFIGMEPRMMLDTFKSQCFRNAAQVSDAQLAAFVSIANEMKVNPLLPGMMYAYPTSGGGIVPMMGPDAVFKKLAEHPDVDSWETVVFPEDPTQPPTHAITKIYRKKSDRPLCYTAILSEWKVGNNPNWNSRPRHMLQLRSLKQCARQIIHGIPLDEDERVIQQAIDVTPAEQQRETPPKGAASVPPADSEATPERKTRARRAAPAPEVVVPAEPAPEAPKAEVVPAAEAPKAEAAPTPVADTIPGDPITELADGQRVSVTIKVATLATGNIDKMPSVKASVNGGFIGEVRHVGGAVANPPGDPVASEPWKVGAELVVGLIGRKYTGAAPALAGKVLAYVEKVEAVPEVF